MGTHYIRDGGVVYIEGVGVPCESLVKNLIVYVSSSAFLAAWSPFAILGGTG
jgi:hypothetical protein